MEYYRGQSCYICDTCWWITYIIEFLPFCQTKQYYLFIRHFSYPKSLRRPNERFMSECNLEIDLIHHFINNVSKG